MQDPNLMQNMINSPYMQNVMQNISNNPDLATQILSTNPMLANNPELRETMLQQMQRPEMQAVFTNPRGVRIRNKTFRSRDISVGL